MGADDIRARLAAGELTLAGALPLVEAELATAPSVQLWLLRGRLIQLTSLPGYQLQDALESLRQASLCAPDDPEPYEELGHFHDAVLDDLATAERYFREALDRGAGPECAEALQDVLQQAKERRAAD